MALATNADRASRDRLTDESAAVRFYDERYAAGYMEDWPSWKKRRVASFIRELNLPQTGRALDFGCGQGVFTEVLRQTLPGWTISGTDLSPEALQAARTRFPGCEFFQLPAETRDPSIAPFDFLFTHHVLEHVLHLDRTWELMASFLKPGGAMLHILPCGDAGTLERRICSLRTDGVDPARGNRYFYEDEGHVRRLQSAELDAVARRYGLQPGARRFANAYWGGIEWITEAGPDWVRTLTENTQARDAAAKAALRRLRLALLILSVARLPAASPGRLVKQRSGLKKWAGIAGYPLARGLDRFLKWQSEREWQSAGTGSEMYVSFFRTG